MRVLFNLVGLIGVEIRPQFVLRDVTRGLTHNSPQCTRVKFSVQRNGQSLPLSCDSNPPQFDMATSLGVPLKAEGTDNIYHLRT